MAAASTKDRFDAAVKVIQSLPKNGVLFDVTEAMFPLYLLWFLGG